MTTEYHVVIACPTWWKATTAQALADRLLADELPETVGVYVWRLEDGRIAEQETLREQLEDES